eukprot:sb/3478635/
MALTDVTEHFRSLYHSERTCGKVEFEINFTNLSTSSKRSKINERVHCYDNVKIKPVSPSFSPGSSIGSPDTTPSPDGGKTNHWGNSNHVLPVFHLVKLS